MWGGPGVDMDFCLEPYEHMYVVVVWGSTHMCVRISVGSLPGRKSACGEPPAKRRTGLFYPRSAFLGLSGPQPAASQPPSQPASQTQDRFPVSHWRLRGSPGEAQGEPRAGPRKAQGEPREGLGEPRALCMGREALLRGRWSCCGICNPGSSDDISSRSS